MIGVKELLQHYLKHFQHSNCSYHIYCNACKRKTTDNDVQSLFYAAAGAISSDQFNLIMDELLITDIGFFNYINSVKTIWAASFSTYGYTASSVSESINSWIIKERTLCFRDLFIYFRLKKTKNSEKK